ncbi:MAG: hypothetical protein L6R37_005814 [Teloschistes peruensis]|nr:MAG: hypothetical protein L6R37_005814 [Teloschistes peruensis]
MMRIRNSHSSNNNEVHRFSDPEICLKILRGSTYSKDGALGYNKLPFVRSRAIPNQRLVRAFAIDNGFTTSDNESREDFRNWAITKLSTFDEKRWKDNASQANQLVEKQMQIISHMCNIPLECAVQIVSLKLIFKEFFKLDPIGLGDKTMLEIAQEINHQWIASKSVVSEGSLGHGKFQALFESLKLHSDRPRHNPLNTLLPVYETLWRVVTHCIIEVIFRPSARPEWLPLLEDFLGDPTRANFWKRSPGTDGVSMEFLVKEALRLYPPTRRIYRQMHMSSKDKSELVAADIETCQRLQSIWGSESHRYQPARWNSVTPTMEKAYMPFGGSPYKCPASGSFGPRMIAVLVAAFASKLSVSEWRLEFQDESGVRSGVLDDEMKLETDRVEGPCWIIQRKDGGIS